MFEFGHRMASSKQFPKVQSQSGIMTKLNKPHLQVIAFNQKPYVTSPSTLLSNALKRCLSSLGAMQSSGRPFLFGHQ